MGAELTQTLGQGSECVLLPLPRKSKMLWLFSAVRHYEESLCQVIAAYQIPDTLLTCPSKHTAPTVVAETGLYLAKLMGVCSHLSEGSSLSTLSNVAVQLPVFLPPSYPPILFFYSTYYYLKSCNIVICLWPFPNEDLDLFTAASQAPTL